VINKALELEGFTEDTPGKEVMTGFAAMRYGCGPQVIEAVKNKAIRHFFPGGRVRRRQTGPGLLHRIGGKRFLRTASILTLACGKFRFFDKDLGDIGGIPACWMWASATMPTRPFRSPWPWPVPLSAG
jgi:hydroxylamine reductase